MVRISYKGGQYDGSIKVIKRKKIKGCKMKCGPLRVPHGFGKYTYQGVSFLGFFKDGYEHGDGIIEWPNGDTFVGNFKAGRPQATVLQFIERSNKLQRRLMKLEATLTNVREDLIFEQEKNMDIALFVDDCQRRIEMLYNIAIAAGADISTLTPLRYPTVIGRGNNTAHCPGEPGAS